MTVDFHKAAEEVGLRCGWPIPELAILAGNIGERGWALFKNVLLDENHLWELWEQDSAGSACSIVLMVKEIWDAFFARRGNPTAIYRWYQQEGYCWKPEFGRGIPDSETRVINVSEGFGRDDEARRSAELEMFRVPCIFEICDYYLRLTRYEYSEKFGTHCCQLVSAPPEMPEAFQERPDLWNQAISQLGFSENIPLVHIAMQPDEMARDIYKKAKAQIGESFFRSRYPRFFKVSQTPDDPFMSIAELKLAYHFQRHTLDQKDLDLQHFAKNARVVGMSEAELWEKLGDPLGPLRNLPLE